MSKIRELQDEERRLAEEQLRKADEFYACQSTSASKLEIPPLSITIAGCEPGCTPTIAVVCRLDNRDAAERLIAFAQELAK